MSTDLHLLPPDQWPDRPPPPPPPVPPKRGGRLATGVLAAVALVAAAGVAVVGVRAVADGSSNDRATAARPAGVASPTSATPPTTQPPTTDPAKAVYLITVDACGLQGTGSGFAIDPHHVVTNAHVVKSDAHPQLRSPTGDRYVGRVIGVNGVRDDLLVDREGPPDVAVIEVDIELPGYLAWAPSSPTVGQVLSGVTFPEGVYTPTTGTVVAGATQGFEIRGDFDHGSSGGAVLAAGGVAGIVTGGSEGGGRAFAFGAGVLRPVVDAILAGPQPADDSCAKPT